MFDLFSSLSTAALIATGLTACAAGFVRGFTGFGAALIFIPLAGAWLGPQAAVATLFFIDAIFSTPLTVGAMRRADWREVLTMAAGASVCVPLGAYFLKSLDPVTLRWAIAPTVLAFLALIASGWRYRGRPSVPVTLAVGGVAGFFGGAAQMAGPPAVAYWLGGALPAATMRANVIAFFTVTTLFSGTAYFANGLLSADALGLSLAIGPLYALAALAGARTFHAIGGRRYRVVAYVVIALAAVFSSPALDGMIR